MKDFEKILKKAPCRDVPDRLDRKMEMEFQKAEEKRWVFFSRPVPLWAHVGICLVCLYAGFAFHSLLSGKSEEPRFSYLIIAHESSIPFYDEMNNQSRR
jgi:hypothetical protein